MDGEGYQARGVAALTMEAGAGVEDAGGVRCKAGQLSCRRRRLPPVLAGPSDECIL